VTLCNYKQEEARFVCRACGDIRKRLVVRECPGDVAHHRAIALPAWVSCPHRGPVIATINGRVAGCGCSGSTVEVYQCNHFHEPVIKQGHPPCLDTLREQVPGATGRTCRECKVPLQTVGEIIHLTHRKQWQDIVRRSEYAMTINGLAARSHEIPNAKSNDTRQAIRGGARVVVNHAFVHNVGEFLNLAKEFPQVQFVATNHCSLNHTYRWPAFFNSIRDYIHALPRLPNLWYGGPDKFSSFEHFVPTECRERVIWWPNPVMLPSEPAVIRPDPPLAMIAFRDDWMKCIPAQILGMSLAKQRRPELRLAIAILFGEKITPHLKSLIDAIRVPWEWWRYGSPDDWYKRLRENVSVSLQVTSHESFGYVAVDAMGYGRPVVCGESVTFCPPAWQVSTERPQEICDKLLEHLDNYEEAAQLARATAEATAASQNANYAALIRRLLER